ncbi:protein kinase [Haloferula sp. BvORR071]|uniref:serine/threonine protein kinase n=1 Tax=Haloferula sp. BvORR071 TaxID=1396141 RepID=UPI00069687B5|nr:protein kinase [Haloferula sp. BvORR071]
MPDLSPETVEALRQIAEAYIAVEYVGWKLENPPGVGGSAAVFKATQGEESRAIKITDPRFFEGGDVASQLKRLELQRRVIDHSCDSLVKIYDLKMYDRTCICVMEHLPWKELKDVIGTIPADHIQPLVDQLVNAVAYLKDIGLIHRDIKPENILISDDLRTLKLVDLGVVREISNNEDRPDSTDHGLHRPFLATAQYSSPEYLFRTAQPSEELWEALNLYQIGAVIHDLISQEELFAEEMRQENRYRLALAVLSKRPIISDDKRRRHNRLASIAEACLIKDSNTRLNIVKLSDFSEPVSLTPSQQLKGALDRLFKSSDIDTDSIIRQQVTSQQIEGTLNKIFEAVFHMLNSEFGSNLELNRIDAANSPTSRTLYAGIPPAGIEYKFTISVTLAESFDLTSEVEVILKDDKEIHSSSPQGAFSLNSETSEEGLIGRLFESISATLIKSLT